jgi:hypothetical protein
MCDPVAMPDQFGDTQVSRATNSEVPLNWVRAKGFERLAGGVPSLIDDFLEQPDSFSNIER